jgi:hypothetical protein
MPTLTSFVTVFALAAGFVAAQNPNTLTPEEQRAGWKLMFDGKSFAGWVDPNLKTPPAHSWQIVDGCIRSIPNAPMLEDLKTEERYGDFEMTFDWKVAPGANTGVKYRVQALVLLTPDKTPKLPHFEQTVESEYQNKTSRREDLKSDSRYQEYPVAFEYQVIDSSRNRDALRGDKYRAAALYGMVGVSSHQDHPQGEWNSSRLLVRGKHVQHWLNGVLVVDTTLDGAEVRESIVNRWKEAPGVRQLLLDQPVAESPILLQNHNDEAWYRNLKIRRLN